MAPADLEDLASAPDPELNEAMFNSHYKLLPTLRPDQVGLIWRNNLNGGARTPQCGSEPRRKRSPSLSTAPGRRCGIGFRGFG